MIVRVARNRPGMNRTVGVCALLAWATAWVVIVVAEPWVLSDQNGFFKGFVNHEFLTFMGVIVTITLASASGLFIELNKLEDRLDAALFTKTKGHLKDSAFWLIGALVAAIVLVIVKPLLAPYSHRMEAGLNGVAVTILLFSVLILIDLTQAAFGLDPRSKD